MPFGSGDRCVADFGWSEVVRTSRSRSPIGSPGFDLSKFSPPYLPPIKLSGRLSSAPESSSSPYIVPIASVTWWLGSDIDSWLA